jgi:hypothetical protein
MRLAAVALAIALAVPPAARANVLVDAAFDFGDVLHVEFVTDVRYNTFDTTSFLLNTTNIPGVTVTDFNYSLLSTGSCHFGGAIESGIAECFTTSNGFGFASGLQATADPNVFASAFNPSNALTFSQTDLPVTNPTPLPPALPLFGAGLAGLGRVLRTRRA